MGFSGRMRVAPGLSFTASGRGVRTSIGPRAARLNVGAGRATVSSGFGPFSASKGVGKRSHTRSRSADTSSIDGLFAALQVVDLLTTPWQMAMERETKLMELAQKDAKRVVKLTSLHRERFRESARQIAKPERETWWKKATPDARAAAATQQDEFDAAWDAVVRHQPEAVIPLVDEALGDNVSVSTCIDAGTNDGQRYVTLVVIYPGHAFTKGYVLEDGKGRERSKSERDDLYRAALASTVVATCAEAFATAPSAQVAYIAVLRSEKARLRARTIVPVYGAAFSREAVMGPDWQSASPGDLVWHPAYIRTSSDRLEPLEKTTNSDLYDIATHVAAATSDR